MEFNANDHFIWGVAGEPIGADILVDARDDDGDPIVREQVRYTLDWRWGKAQRHSAGGGRCGPTSDISRASQLVGSSLATWN